MIQSQLHLSHGMRTKSVCVSILIENGVALCSGCVISSIDLMATYKIQNGATGIVRKRVKDPILRQTTQLL